MKQTHSEDFLGWLTEKGEATSKKLKETPHASPEWIIAFHRLQTLDECTREYKASLITYERRA